LNARRLLLELFDAALRAVDGRLAVERFLRESPVAGPVAIFAIGKAAGAMTLGAHAALSASVVETLVITKDGHGEPALEGRPATTVLETAHPVPDARSLAAGAALERRLRALPPSVTPVFLVSGGASSLVESLRDAATLEDLAALNARGLAAGWDIATLNAERTKLSRLKGGGVARLLGGRPALALFLSDVPRDDPGVIGSGLLGRDADAHDAIDRRVVANVEQAVNAAREAAAARGLDVEVRGERFDGDAGDVALRFVEALRATPSAVLVWGGESTVELPERSGRGGRNTHLALAAARRLRADESLTILAAGTDGTDGPTCDAGAIIDGRTIERAEIGGCDVERAMREFDSGLALESAGDLVHTGPTGTNVGDILIGCKRLPRML
jgi:hydroxypyruvate reductase